MTGFRAIRLRRIAALTALAVAAACEPRGDDAPSSAEPPPLDETADTLTPDPVRTGLAEAPAPIDVTVPDPNPRRGRILFITNGCVICHQVNAVGGSAGPTLDENLEGRTLNSLDFSARMWRGARAMTALQSLELGYVIELEGEDIADLAAFVSSPDERALLTLDSVSIEMRDWFINEPYWIDENWDEYKDLGVEIPLGDPE